MKEVIKFNGKKALLKNCKKINNKYYEKNLDVFLMNDGRWNRIDNGKIVFDNENKIPLYLKDSGHLIFGIIGLSENNKFILGYFSPNMFENVKIALTTQEEYDNFEKKSFVQKSYYNCIKSNFLEKLNYKRNKKSDYYTINGNLSNSFILNAENYEYNVDKSLKQSIRNFEDFKNKYKKRSKIKLNQKTKYTYGYEFESSAGSGVLSDVFCNRNGLIRLKDGSLRVNDFPLSFEYATVPFSSSDSIHFIPKICKELKSIAKFNETCSLHLHVGNFNGTMMNVVALWVLINKVQSEMLKMFPAYKLNPEIIGSRKNYCKKIPDLSIINILEKNKQIPLSYKIKPIFSNIFKYLSQGKEMDNEFNRRSLRHPQTRKWNIKTRYHIVNLVSLIFSENRTVEFRLHTPTFNSEKIINWTYICSALLYYAENESYNILSDLKKSYSFNEIISEVYKNNEELRDNLINYMYSRKSFYKNDRGDLYLKEFQNDEKTNLNTI